MDVTGKKVLITGANRGIGLALAKELNRQGAHVYGAMRSPESFDKEAQDFSDASRFHKVLLDMGSFEGIEKFLSEYRDFDFDILINNAGQLTGGLVEEQDTQDIYSMFQVNIVGLVHLTKGLLPRMVKRGSGKIVNNSSVSGVMHLPCASTYAAAKTAVVAFTNSLHLELEGTGVTTLTLITPGIKTRMFDEISDYYGKHMDVSQLSSIPPEKYARKVFKAIQKDDLFYEPSGTIGLALWIARHTPALFRKLGKLGFKR